MDSPNSSSSDINPTSGYCSKTSTFHSLRPPLHHLLPPPHLPLSAPSYALSLSSTSTTTTFIDSATSLRLSSALFRRRVASLAASLQTLLHKHDTALIISPTTPHLPILLFSLLSIGVVVSPVNPASTQQELLRLVKLSNPVVVFATSATCQKLPKLNLPVILIDSPEFDSMMSEKRPKTHPDDPEWLKSNAAVSRVTSQISSQSESCSTMMLEKHPKTHPDDPEWPKSNAAVSRVTSQISFQSEFTTTMQEKCPKTHPDDPEWPKSNTAASRVTSQISSQSECIHSCENVLQSDVAAILYSSGTTGNVKGVSLTHRNLIASIANYYYARRPENNTRSTTVLYTVPLFHVFGLHYLFKSVALSETVVLMERFDFKRMLKAVEEFRVTQLVVAPPVVVAMAKGSVTNGYDLSSLETVGSGGAPLGEALMQAFEEKFPNTILYQGYGLTETTGAAFRAVTTEEMLRRGSVGRLIANCEAKIVDPDTGIALPPGKQGELWIRGPTIMQGYVGDPKATSETLVSGGWLKTGDLCYIDDQGFLFIVDRLKELIKYKGYQVAPAELEQLLQTHPEIVDTAVIPYPDEEAGQVPMAFVVRWPQSSLDEAQVIEFISKQVSPYKKIRRVAFISSIPKSPSGKILRKDLVRIYVPGSKL